jgi:hypothetical protein
MTPTRDPEREQSRLEELKRKVHDEAYLAGAIQRIAQVMSAEIMEGYGAAYGGRKQGL